LADLFFGVQVVDPAWFMGFWRGLIGGFWGLTCDFWAKKEEKHTRATNKSRSTLGMTTRRHRQKQKQLQ
jgi:hypothetical protein